MLNLLSTHVALIGGADGPTSVTVAGDIPWPAICVSVFAVLFIIYVYAMKAINAKKVVAEEPSAPSEAAVQSAPVYTGPELIGVSEKEAAVVMAVVSHKTGIPLNRLRFDSIKLTEDK